MPETIEQSTALTTQDHFTPFETQANEWMEKAKAITVTDASQVNLIKGAREARLALRDIRIGVENTRKELKEEYLRKGNEIQGIANRLKGLIEPIEDYLQKQEDFVKLQEEIRKKELFDQRYNHLSTLIGGKEAITFPLAEMTQEAFENMCEGYRLAAEAKAKYDQEQLAIQEKQRFEREAEDKRIREENERLQAENDRIEREHAIERAKVQAKLKKEQDEVKRLEREAALKAEQEEQARKNKQAEDRKAKRAPDKVKLIAFANQIDNLQCLSLSDPEAQKILDGANELLSKTKSYILKNADKL